MLAPYHALRPHAYHAPESGVPEGSGEWVQLDRCWPVSAMKTTMCRSFRISRLSSSLPVRGVLAGTALFATGSWAVAATRGHGAGAGKAPPWSVAACMKMVGEDPSGALDYAQDAVHAGAGWQARHCRALAQLETGDEATAATDLEALAKLPTGHADGPSSADQAQLAREAADAWLALGQAARAQACAEYGLARQKQDQGLVIVLVRALLDQNQTGAARDVLTGFLAVVPQASSQTYVLLATAERRMGQIGPALGHVSRALALDPLNPEALLERGIISEQQGHAASARQDWQQVLELAPDSHEADLARQDLAVMAADPDSP